ncbi:ferredoxin-NADP reductase [miscellaneous Crenarchaeota group-15 archaeon DG-45]|uniref:Ferredoxin-NADP reductase n=1 Tax=miscellaneous Crenarchaeota group-15 archaeon DG-45 TaxID=1685127 RepID=A0A0M0BSJ6_9ARCH|nr:MAG: ferredoxin-NADP reductase [miscellaneous Crenarchaeota group-15 archaeon DG-45]
MYRIVKKRALTSNIKMFEIEAPAVATKARPGNFVILRLHEKGERIPITLSDADPEGGTISIIFAEVGKSSAQLGALEEGDRVLNLAGPLGNPARIEKYGRVLGVGGGVFVGAFLYQIRALKEAGNRITAVVGARSPEHLILVDEVRAAADETYIATDDGEVGQAGLWFLEGLLQERRFDHVFTLGPTSMQRDVSEMTGPLGIPTTVNLFPIMVDGMGMCGACRVTVGGETKFACVDGPDFDGHRVDFEELISRMRVYNPQEKLAMVLYDKVM